MIVAPNNSCSACSKKIVAHKVKLRCWTCSQYLHTRCANLTPNDVVKLDVLNLYKYWTCIKCTQEIFPFIHAINKNEENVFNDNSNDRYNENTCTYSRVNCNTCSKLGNSTKMRICWLCNNLTHSNCMRGVMGCRKCLTNIYPGLESTTRELFCQYQTNDLVFNPFDYSHNVHHVGETSEDDSYEYTAWSGCSELLNNCKYSKPNEISNSRDYELKVFSLNIRSLNSKITEIRDNLSHYAKFDLICLNETNCDPKNLPFGGNELELDFFHAPILQAPARSSGKGGGLAIYINKKLAALPDVDIKTFASCNSDPMQGEFLTIEIVLKNRKNVIICNMYRSPSGDLDKFFDKLNQTLQQLNRHRNKQILFVSDSNIDLLKHGHFENATKLVDIFSEHGFAPLISRPTRITNHSATLIDHIFSNNCHTITQSGIITENLSDHLAVYVSILMDPHKVNLKISEDTTSHEHHFISDEKLTNFKSEIASTDWTFLNQIDSADKKFENFEHEYNKIYQKHFPPKPRRAKKRKNEKPWILPWLQAACDRKNAMYKTFVKNPTIENETKYKKLKRFVTKHIKKAKNKFYDNYFRKFSNDGRKQWQMINNLLNRKTKNKKNITSLDYKNKLVTGSQEIANSLNDFFCNIAQKLKDENSALGTGGVPPDYTLRNRILLSMSIEDCTDIEIKNIINSLKNKATSDLGIKPLKFVSSEISPVLSYLISSSLQQGIFPTKLKCAKVIPLHKGGNSTNISNYRPISLLSCFSKIYEKVMHARLTKFLNENDIIFKSQYGFRSGHCCEHALLEAQRKISHALEQKQIAVLLFLDFSKAFDMVDHEILLRKLEHYGIRGVILSWFRSYLTNREQYVYVDNCKSDMLKLNYSVPQGSILGPTLFILYINDLPNIDKFTQYIFFADDANIIITGYTFEEVSDKVNLLLQKVQTWILGNGLKLNLSKTKYMIFTNKTKQSIDVNFCGVKIEESESERFLGVVINSKLNWTNHINLLASKISRNAGILYKLKDLVSEKTLKTLFHSFIQSHLNYCSTVWGLGSKNSLIKLFVAQKKAIRSVHHKLNYQSSADNEVHTPCHTKEIFSKLQILSLPNLVAKNCLIMMHKIYLNLTPVNINDMFTVAENKNRNARREAVYFNVPFFRLKSTDKTIPYRGAIIYNEFVNNINKLLPTGVPRLQNKFMDQFKSLITKHLLQIQTEGDVTWSDQNFILYT